MKNRKGFIIVLAAVIVLAMTACDNGGGGGGGEGTVTLRSIQVTNLPEKKLYVLGEEFDAAGLVVSGRYSDNTIKVITGYNLDIPEDFTTEPGTKTIGVKFDSRSTAFDVYVRDSGDEVENHLPSLIVDYTIVEVALAPDEETLAYAFGRNDPPNSIWEISFTLLEPMDISEYDYFVYDLASEVHAGINSLAGIYTRFMGSGGSAGVMGNNELRALVGPTTYEDGTWLTFKTPLTVNAGIIIHEGDVDTFRAIMPGVTSFMTRFAPVGNADALATNKIYIKDFRLEKMPPAEILRTTSARAAANATTAQVTFSADRPVTDVEASDFIGDNGAEITAAVFETIGAGASANHRITLTVTIPVNTGPERDFTITVNPDSTRITFDDTMTATITQLDPNDTRIGITQGSSVNRGATDTTAAVTFRAAAVTSGLQPSDFTITSLTVTDGLSVASVTSGATITVNVVIPASVNMAGNTTYTVGISQESDKIIGTVTATIRQGAQAFEAAPTVNPDALTITGYSSGDPSPYGIATAPDGTKAYYFSAKENPAGDIRDMIFQLAPPAIDAYYLTSGYKYFVFEMTANNWASMDDVQGIFSRFANSSSNTQFGGNREVFTAAKEVFEIEDEETGEITIDFDGETWITIRIPIAPGEPGFVHHENQTNFQPVMSAIERLIPRFDHRRLAVPTDGKIFLRDFRFEP